ncbi:MAG: hypothetical protein ACRERE_42340 [Candidatus Entotheonellia bacterium]
MILLDELVLYMARAFALREDHPRSKVNSQLSKIVGMMCPPLFRCRTNTELCRVRGWDKNLPWRLLGALPKRSWIKRLRTLGRGRAGAAVAPRRQ